MGLKKKYNPLTAEAARRGCVAFILKIKDKVTELTPLQKEFLFLHPNGGTEQISCGCAI